MHQVVVTHAELMYYFSLRVALSLSPTSSGAREKGRNRKRRTNRYGKGDDDDDERCLLCALGIVALG